MIDCYNMYCEFGNYNFKSLRLCCLKVSMEYVSLLNIFWYAKVKFAYFERSLDTTKIILHSQKLNVAFLVFVGTLGVVRNTGSRGYW